MARLGDGFFGWARRASWACIGKRLEFRETEAPESSDGSKGNAPTGCADEQIRWKPMFHPKKQEVPSEGSRTRAAGYAKAPG